MKGRFVSSISFFKSSSIVALAALSALAVVRLLHAAAPAGPPEPELVGEGVLSTSADEVGSAFTPDGGTIYFTLRSPTTSTPPLSVICVSHLAHGRWSAPEVAPFSGRYNDMTPAVSPDGRRLFFASDRPAPGRAAGKDGADLDLWVMDRAGTGWSLPRNLGAPVNTAGLESHPSVAADGTLYFSSIRPGGKGSLDLYRSRLADGRYGEPEPLEGINSAAYEGQPAVAPDQSFLVFTGVGRPDGLIGGGNPYPRGDLYVSFRRGDGWSPPRPLPPPVNSTASDSSPTLSPDGRWLYFTSERSPFVVPQPRRLTARELEERLHGILNGMGNLYRVDAAVIHALEAPAS
jgi:hypothetical protein